MKFLYDMKTKRYAGIVSQLTPQFEGNTFTNERCGETEKFPHFKSGYTTVFDEETRSWTLIHDIDYLAQFKNVLGSNDMDAKLLDIQNMLQTLVKDQYKMREYFDTEFKSMHGQLCLIPDTTHARLKNRFDTIDNLICNELDDKLKTIGININNKFMDIKFDIAKSKVANERWAPKGVAYMVEYLYDYYRKPWYKRIFSRVPRI